MPKARGKPQGTTGTKSLFSRISLSLHDHYVTAFTALGLAGALIIPSYILWLILSGSALVTQDYFDMFPSLYAPNGDFTPRGFIEHATEHLVLIPKVVYLVNFLTFDGSNITLGLFVWFVSVATAVVVVFEARRTFSFTPSTGIVFAWSVSVFLFPLAAADNFIFGMSGTAWILANFFAVTAILATVKGRSITGGFLGVLGTFTYGTGLAIWPALIAVLILKARFTIRDQVMLVMGALSVVFQQLTPGPNNLSPNTEPLSILTSFTSYMGSSLTHDANLQLLIGTIFLVSAGLLVLRSKRRRGITQGTLFAGITVWGLVSFLFIAVSRPGFPDVSASRYMAVVSLFVFGLTTLALVTTKRPALWSPSVLVIITMSLTASLPFLRWVQEQSREQQQLGEIAISLGVGTEFIEGYQSSTELTFSRLGHYPFNSPERDIGCGLLGKKVADPLAPEDGEVLGYVESKIPTKVARNKYLIRLGGWAYSPRDVSCILVLNQDSVVVGAGISGWLREDVMAAYSQIRRRDAGWKAVARVRSKDEELRTVVKTAGNHSLFLLDTISP